LRLKANRLIGYAWHHTPVNNFHPILDRFVHAAAIAAKMRGYHLLTFVVDESEPGALTYAELYDRNLVAGFILADTVQDDPRIAFLIERHIPFTSFGRAHDGWDHCWVDVDGEYGLRATIAHLIEKGHQRIGLITWPTDSLSGHARNSGYWAALGEAGLPADPRWVWRGANSAETGSRAVAELLQLPVEQRPTALACVSDIIAIGALNAAAAHDLVVGRDIAITGFDDVPLAEHLHPPLTSVYQPIEAAGELCIELLLQQILERRVERPSVLLKPRLVIRASSGGQ
jgi:DNA-binding LacI/PurR family transcriptional regulator